MTLRRTLLRLYHYPANWFSWMVFVMVALLLRIANALDVPAGQGRNWDALADQLRDLSWRPSSGHVLLFDDARGLRDADEASFDTLLDILSDAAADWSAQELPFWAFLALPEDEFDAPE